MTIYRLLYIEKTVTMAIYNISRHKLKIRRGSDPNLHGRLMGLMMSKRHGRICHHLGDWHIAVPFSAYALLDNWTMSCKPEAHLPEASSLDCTDDNRTNKRWMCGLSLRNTVRGDFHDEVSLIILRVLLQFMLRLIFYAWPCSNLLCS